MLERRVERMAEVALRGVGASAGIALGAVLVHRAEVAEQQRPAESPDQELARYRAAVQQVEEAMVQLANQTAPPEQEILSAHRLMLRDPDLTRMVEEGIAGGKDVEQAVAEAIAHFAAMVEALGDLYLRERVADVRTLGRRLQEALGGRAARPKLHRPAILVAHDLDPTDTVGLDRSLLLGIVTEQGGPTDHTSMLARTWGIPAVVGVAGLLERVKEGQALVLDGASGDLVIDPGPVTRAQFRERLLKGSPGVDPP